MEFLPCDVVRWQPELSVADYYVYGKFSVGPTRWEVRWRSMAAGEDLLVSPLAPCCDSVITATADVSRSQRLFACGASCDQAMKPVRMADGVRWLSHAPPNKPDREAIAIWVEQAYNLNALEEEIFWSSLIGWDWAQERHRARTAARRVARLRGLAPSSVQV